MCLIIGDIARLKRVHFWQASVDWFKILIFCIKRFCSHSPGFVSLYDVFVEFKHTMRHWSDGSMTRYRFKLFKRRFYISSLFSRSSCPKYQKQTWFFKVVFKLCFAYQCWVSGPGASSSLDPQPGPPSCSWGWIHSCDEFVVYVKRSCRSSGDVRSLCADKTTTTLFYNNPYFWDIMSITHKATWVCNSIRYAYITELIQWF